ncbi:exo-alpha-sialidase [Archangium violaceum]|uniref:WD40/YVTN/BNR-like repeat-containing protein n=1 Tax=Archangium violaceum TaxID=83451 RepID=UPI00194E47C4|nr:sialidase family protein [Archangium violaceum]QRN98256.1 exo-alpha-sialidase [Archangium violaceum]
MRLPPSVRYALVLTSLALRAPPALAHAGLPETSNVTVRRGHPEDLFVGTTFGAVVSRDSGKTWRWICPQAMLYGGWRPESFLWQAHGELLAATGASLIRSRDGGCTWEAHPFFSSRNLWPSGLESPASTPSRAWVTTARAAAPNGLFRSDDGGETFTETSLKSTTDVYTAVKVAPSDPRRLYVSASTPKGLRIFRSDNEGSTWEEIPQPFPEYSVDSRPYDLLILRIAENDPDHLWARVTAQGWTYLLESKDGGHTFQSVLHPPNQDHDGLDEYLVGIEVSADGRTVWAATYTRFFRIRDGGPTTLLSLPEGNACADRQGDALLVCGSTWVHDWALARTRDEGDTYEPLFSLPHILPSACPAGTPTQDVCRPLWPQFAPSIGADPTLPPEEPVEVDAGTPEAPPKKSGCSSTGGLVPTACLLTLTPLLRSRRRDPESSRR